MKHLRGFEDKYPSRLEAEFPHIVDTLAELWDRHEIAGYFAQLLVYDPCDRQEFPPAIAHEIFLLSVAYDEIHNMRCKEINASDGQWDPARKAIELLNIRVAFSRPANRPG